MNEWLAVGASGSSEVPSKELKFLPVKCSVLSPLKSPVLDSSCVPRLQALPAQFLNQGVPNASGIVTTQIPALIYPWAFNASGAEDTVFVPNS